MRKPWSTLALGLVLLSASLVATAQHATPAGEASPAGEHAAPPAAHAGGEHGEDAAKPALLQFDPGAAIWSIIVFLVLLIVLRAAAWKPILRVLNEREKFIETSIADARSEREKAEQLLGQYQAQLEKARADASAIVDEGRRDAEAVRQRILEEAHRDQAEAAERARREIQLATESAIRELYDRTAELSVDVAARVLKKELTPADHQRLIGESIAEIKAGGPAKLN